MSHFGECDGESGREGGGRKKVGGKGRTRRTEVFDTYIGMLVERGLAGERGEAHEWVCTRSCQRQGAAVPKRLQNHRSLRFVGKKLLRIYCA